MLRVKDKGHSYTLLTLDQRKSDPIEQGLIFVKRSDAFDPTRFPGDYNSYPGTTVQSVVRCLLERMRYLQKQKWCVENVFVVLCFKFVLWFMEFRGARRHGKLYLKTLKYAETAPLCSECGHTVCDHMGTVFYR